MSIAKKVVQAIEEMARNDPEAALTSASIAVAATARLAHPKLKDNEAHKQFLNDNMGLIASIALPVIRVTGQAKLVLGGKYTHPRVKAAKDGYTSLADILYHVVRCSLVHEAGLPSNVQFSEGTLVSQPDKLVLPRTIVSGLIVAVVVATVNKAEMIAPSYQFTFGGKSIPLNDLWGRRDIVDRFMNEPRLTE